VTIRWWAARAVAEEALEQRLAEVLRVKTVRATVEIRPLLVVPEE
jgi:hypothetical protein